MAFSKGNELQWQKLRAIAQASLQKNIVNTEQGQYVRAGAHQFGSLWTRDFCFAVPGLVAIGERRAAENHLLHLVRVCHPESRLIPRILESGSSAMRVVFHSGLRFLPLKYFLKPIRSPLHPEYLGEHGTRSMDSNLLVFIMCGTLAESWSPESKDEMLQGLKPVFEFIREQTQSFKKVISQKAYEDWQDSAARQGEISYTNALTLIALKMALKLGLAVEAEFVHFKKLFHDHFYSETVKLFATTEEKNSFCLETQLLLIDFAVVDDATVIWQSLKKSELWNKALIPGVPHVPQYEKNEISWTCKLAGLSRYHDGFIWAWLSAYSAKIAFKVQDYDSGVQILNHLEEWAVRDKDLGEIYNMHSGKLHESLLFRSERPFSWAAGKTLEALSET